MIAPSTPVERGKVRQSLLLFRELAKLPQSAMLYLKTLILMAFHVQKASILEDRLCMVFSCKIASPVGNGHGEPESLKARTHIFLHTRSV